MLELIASIIFILSVIVFAFVVVKKIPVLAGLPEDGSIGFKKPDLMIKVEEKIKDTHFHIFEKQLWLHKLLSLVKIWTLKIETKIDTLLHRIRKKAQQLDKDVKDKNQLPPTNKDL